MNKESLFGNINNRY